MSLFQTLLLLYVVGIFAVGVPLAAWSIRAWRTRNGKKNRALAFLFPFTCAELGERAFHQGIGTYECGNALIHSIVSEFALLNGVYEEDKKSRLICARYVFVSALTWPLRSIYMIFMAIVNAFIAVIGGVFGELLPTLGGELLLKCRRCIGL